MFFRGSTSLARLRDTFLGLALMASSDAAMVHRWSFNNPAGPAANGSSFPDSISGAIAVVRGKSATLNGSALVLPGSTTGKNNDSRISAYVNLPNGIISSKTNLTIEIWATPTAARAWQRLFDFGNAATGDGLGGSGEWTGATAPGNTTASDQLSLAVQSGSRFTNPPLAEARLDGGTKQQITSTLTTVANARYHFVLTFADGIGTFGSNGGRMVWYRDGNQVGSKDVPFHLSSLQDVNNWLGRSQVSTERVARLNYDEVRIYNHVLSPVQVASNHTAGPEVILAPPTAQPDAATLHRGQKVRLNVLANDGGNLDPSTVTIVQPPSHGTARVDASGRILYQHEGGHSAPVTFTYRVAGDGGSSDPAQVVLTPATNLRIPNTAVNVPSSPPSTVLSLTPAFGSLTFSQPVCLASPPGNTKQLFVCEKDGAIKVIPDVTATTPTASTVLVPPNLTSIGEQGILGLAFHPSYATNGYFYVFYSVIQSFSAYQRVSRFTMNNPAAAVPTVVAGSELILINQFDQASNHNGGDLHFGPDGYLYISVGDEGGADDQFNNSQRINLDLFAGLLRIDVDKKPGSLAPKSHPAIPLDAGVARFAIPPDNPFVGATSFNGSAVSASTLRTEFWAVGLRNPWRFSFDSQTGEIWLGDVGQGNYEEVNLITKGGNYGWAFREGRHAGAKSGQTPGGFTSIDPIYEYRHSGQTSNSSFEGNSITGGVVYRGNRISDLQGAYIFADYSTGNIWSLRRTGGDPVVQRILGQGGIVAFGTDPSNKDVLLADIDNGVIRRLIAGDGSSSFPATLSETGLFTDVLDLSPSPGLLPYEPNVPFWSDHAVKRRWMIIPDGTSQMTWSREGSWTFPNGTIWVKHFDIDMTRGNPATRRRLETRLIVKNSTGVYGVSYRWNETQTEATLVGDSGEDFDLAITENGTPRTQRWRIPSRAECLVCHTSQAGYALSFNTRQLNRSYTINSFTGNQLDLFNDSGMFSNAIERPNVLPRHLRSDETAFPVEARVRSYLDVNCAYCHKSGGTAPTAWDGRASLTLDETGLLNGIPVNNGGNAANKLVIPGDLDHSVVYNRVAAANGFTRMPPIASNETDPASIALLTEWITQSLPARKTYTLWRQEKLGSLTSPASEPGADPDGDGRTNQEEFLAATDPLSGSSVFAATPSIVNGQFRLSFYAPENKSIQVESSTNLSNWTLWDIPGNEGLPQTGGMKSLQGPVSGDRNFFRLKLRDN